MSKNIDDYLNQGMYGPQETNPDERRRYLGTIRERVVCVLTKNQVRENGIYSEVEDFIRENKKATLILNGNMNYDYLSDYIKLANKYNLKFTLSTNKEYDSELGLVLAHDYAINKEDITIKKEASVIQEKKAKDHSIKNFFKKLF